MKVRVNRELCEGHSRCKALAPALFDLDEFGNATEAGDGTVPPAMEKQARLAKANCPEFAIEILEDEG